MREASENTQGSTSARMPDCTAAPASIAESALASLADVLVAMSGGVDSSVTALLLAREGYHVIGTTMVLFGNELIGSDAVSGCCSADDVADARDVCSRLGVEHYALNMKGRFKRDVVDRFCRTYVSGGTPNPCVDCNKYLKFAALQQRRKEFGARYVATGHYARRLFDPTTQTWQLWRGVDRAKDQSYVLYDLTQEELAHMLFPLGDLTKAEVRRLADEAGLTTAKKRESQDICFVPDGDYAGFIKRYTAANVSEPPFSAGDIVDIDGVRLGTHRGLIHYTVGQRRGIGIASTEPLYVYEIRMSENELVVAPENQLKVDALHVSALNIIAGDYDVRAFDAEAQTAYRRRPVPVRVEIGEGRTAVITYETPQVPTAPGQSVVLYDGDRVIGGGHAV